MRQRREQSREVEAEIVFDQREQDDLDLEALCEANPVARHIIIGIDLQGSEASASDMRRALSVLAGTKFLYDKEVIERYRVVAQLHADMVRLVSLRDQPAQPATNTDAYQRLGSIANEMRPSWSSSGACNGSEPDLFFPERGASTRMAKEVCQSCVVMEECLEYALSNRETFGIWGGMSERQRRRIRKQRNLAAAKQED